MSKVTDWAIENQPHIIHPFQSEQLGYHGYAMLILGPTGQMIKFRQHMVVKGKALNSPAPGYRTI